MTSHPSSPVLQAVIAELLPELHAKASCEQVGLTAQSFSEILLEVGSKYSVSASAGELRSFFLSLRVDELALARACAGGNNSAWEIFLTRFREKLYLAALRIAREDSAARDLADTLYADLYGTSTRDGQRVSKLASYTGRGSLEGWLRTVLAQEYVNRYRRTKRLVSLEEESEEGLQFRGSGSPTLRQRRHSAGASDRRSPCPAPSGGSRRPRRLLSGWTHSGRDCPHAGGA